jgi:hypothetical protein
MQGFLASRTGLLTKLPLATPKRYQKSLLPLATPKLYQKSVLPSFNTKTLSEICAAFGNTKRYQKSVGS